MNVTLLMTRDKHNTIGSDNGIPWDCSSIHASMKDVIKNKVVIVGSNSREHLSFIKDAKIKLLIVMTHEPRKSSKYIQYHSDMYTALDAAKQLDTDVFILGGIKTMNSFLNEGLITNIIFYIVDSAHDGLQFKNSSPNDYSLISVQSKPGYVISKYIKVPSELKVGDLLSVKKVETNEIKKKQSLTNMSNDEILSSIDNELDYDDEEDDTEDELSLDELYEWVHNIDDAVNICGKNQSSAIDRINALTASHQQLSSMMLINNAKILDLETAISRLSRNNIILCVGIITTFVLLLISVIGIICLR